MNKTKFACDILNTVSSETQRTISSFFHAADESNPAIWSKEGLEEKIMKLVVESNQVSNRHFLVIGEYLPYNAGIIHRRPPSLSGAPPLPTWLKVKGV